jgi:hypothetical protein
MSMQFLAFHSSLIDYATLPTRVVGTHYGTGRRPQQLLQFQKSCRVVHNKHVNLKMRNNTNKIRRTLRGTWTILIGYETELREPSNHFPATEKCGKRHHGQWPNVHLYRTKQLVLSSTYSTQKAASRAPRPVTHPKAQNLAAYFILSSTNSLLIGGKRVGWVCFFDHETISRRRGRRQTAREGYYRSNTLSRRMGPSVLNYLFFGGRKQFPWLAVALYAKRCISNLSLFPTNYS